MSQEKERNYYINQVEGFNPFARIKPATDFVTGEAKLDENGEPEVYLPFKEQLTWFRLKYPTGKIAVDLVEVPPERVCFRSRVYADRNDPVDCFLAEGYGERYRSTDAAFPPVATAQSQAISKALTNAGFGCEVGSFAGDLIAPDRSPFEKAVPPSPTVKPTGKKANQLPAAVQAALSDEANPFIDSNAKAAPAEKPKKEKPNPTSTAKTDARTPAPALEATPEVAQADEEQFTLEEAIKENERETVQPAEKTVKVVEAEPVKPATTSTSTPAPAAEAAKADGDMTVDQAKAVVFGAKGSQIASLKKFDGLTMGELVKTQKNLIKSLVMKSRIVVENVDPEVIKAAEILADIEKIA